MNTKVITMEVLQDSTTSNLLKQKVAFVRLTGKNGILVSTLATGYVTVTQDVKKGDKHEIEVPDNAMVKVTQSNQPITLRQGTPEEEEVTPEWLSIVH